MLLPVSRAEVAPTIESPDAHSAPTRRGRILIIDDEPKVAAAVSRMLARDHDVEALTSASAALERIVGGERFDVIIADVMMPQVTGMDFYRELLKVAPEQVDSVAFMSGGAFTPAARAFFDQVQAARIEKPFGVQALRELVARIMAR